MGSPSCDPYQNGHLTSSVPMMQISQVALVWLFGCFFISSRNLAQSNPSDRVKWWEVWVFVVAIKHKRESGVYILSSIFSSLQGPSSKYSIYRILNYGGALFYVQFIFFFSRRIETVPYSIYFRIVINLRGMPFCGLLPNFAPSAEAKHVAKKNVIISYMLPGFPM